MTAIQQVGEYDGSIDTDLSVLLQMLVESAESAVCLGQPVYFSVDLGI